MTLSRVDSVHIYGSCNYSSEQILENFFTNRTDWLENLKGSWSLVVKQNNKTILATDRWGTRPLFYAFNNDALVYSEDVDAVLRALTTVTANEEALARILLEDFSHPEETIFNEIKKVPQGTVLTYELGAAQSVRWTGGHLWESEDRGFAETVSLWKKELTGHLEKILPLHSKWGVFVSGGLDSTGLVALSLDLIKKHQWPITLELYNMTTDHPESYDQEFCNKLANSYQIPLIHHCTTPDDLSDLFAIWKKSRSSLPFFPTLQMFEPLMKKAAANQCTGILFGYGADEQWTLPPKTLGLDFLTNAQWSLFLENGYANPKTSSYFLEVFKFFLRQNAPSFIKRLFHSFNNHGLPKHLFPHPIFKKQRSQLRKNIQALQQRFTSVSQKQLFLRNYLSGNNQYNLACHITLAQSCGLKVHFPYLSPEMLEISLHTSPALLYLARDKRVLRDVLKGHLLEEIRTAPKFQDYCQLAFKTSLLLEEVNQECLLKRHWLKIQPQLLKAAFDDDSFFEAVFVEKILNTSEDMTNE